MDENDEEKGKKSKDKEKTEEERAKISKMAKINSQMRVEHFLAYC
jgi:hypothetical protein